MGQHPAGAIALITLLTDFGQEDGYAGAMKGVVMSLNPRARLVDITHEIAPHDVLQGAYALLTSYAYFPAGTIHVAVVDPGVGSQRRGIVLQTPRHLFVGPDNGLFSFIYDAEQPSEVHSLTRPEWWRESDPGGTFHGRDIFAPVAAHLSLGISPERLGERVQDPVRFPHSQATITRDEVQGEILHVDHFGNLVTNIPDSALGPRRFELPLRDYVISRVTRSYETGRPGEPMLLVGSSGFLEIAVRRGRAEEVLNLHRGDPVCIDFTGENRTGEA
jgi:S-adenosylmethionine hydrolase